MFTAGEHSSRPNGADTRTTAALAATGSWGTDTRYVSDLADSAWECP